MSTHKHIDRICIAAVVLSLVLTILFMNGSALGIQAVAAGMGYEDRLFDTERVHTIDIVIDDWEGFLETCQSETYTVCNVVIDGEAYRNVGIRGKGNTSLSTVQSLDSSRYSFKLEFDQYDDTKSYYGLDKLSLNNLIYDTTYMKDYLTYQLMASFGVNTPLCSYVYITVNGEDWGLYLAVEGVEDAFLQRNYGTDNGELYKPDTAELGGGIGNGQDFDFEEIFGNLGGSENDSTDTGNQFPNFGGGMGQGNFPGFGGTTGENVTGPGSSAGGNDTAADATEPSDSVDGGFTFPEGFDPSDIFGGELPEGFDPSDIFGGELPEDFNPSGNFGGEGGFGMMGMGAADVMLQYVDDNVDSYANIFNNAKTDITTTDMNRLVASLKDLSESVNLEEVLDIDQLLRYFVVHNFVVSSDSYTGQMIHNYYLYEEDGKLSMIPWDYNLAVGTHQNFQESDAVNDPIDSPLSVTGDGTRPMVDWIWSSEEYTELYHQYFAEFLSSTDILTMIADTVELIAPYVQEDPTAFYGYEDFAAGVAELTDFCDLRIQSVQGQLDGIIPSTSEGQAADSSTLIDASALDISAMGTMSASDVMGGMMGGNGEQGGNGGFGGFPGGQGGIQWPGSGEESTDPTGESNTGNVGQFPGSVQWPGQSGGTVTDPTEETTENGGMTQLPGGNQFGGGFTGGIQDGFTGNFPTEDDVVPSSLLSALPTIVASVVVLLLGLTVAILFKRR